MSDNSKFGYVLPCPFAFTAFGARDSPQLVPDQKGAKGAAMLQHAGEGWLRVEGQLRPGINGAQEYPEGEDGGKVECGRYVEAA